MSHLSRRDIDDLKSSIDKVVYKALGNSDSSIVSTAVHCLNSGYDKRKTIDKLASYVESKKAAKIADKIFDIIDDYRSTHRTKKRSHDDSRDRERDSKRSKIRNHESDRDGKSSSDRPKSSSRPNEVKNGEQKDSESPKAAGKNNLNISNLNIPPPSIYGIPMGLLNRGDADKARKIAQLQAQIKSKLSSGILGNVIQLPAPQKPTPLILDEEGRTVDKTGKAVQLTHVVPTLKANIRAQKREQFKSQHQEKIIEENSETKFFDTRIGVKPPVRIKRALRFHEPGKFQQMAERIRMKILDT